MVAGGDRHAGGWRLGGDDRGQPPGVGRTEPGPHGTPRGGDEERRLGAELLGQGEGGAFQPFGALGLHPPGRRPEHEGEVVTPQPVVQTLAGLVGVDVLAGDDRLGGGHPQGGGAGELTPTFGFVLRHQPHADGVQVAEHVSRRHRHDLGEVLEVLDPLRDDPHPLVPQLGMADPVGAEDGGDVGAPADHRPEELERALGRLDPGVGRDAIGHHRHQGADVADAAGHRGLPTTPRCRARRARGSRTEPGSRRPPRRGPCRPRGLWPDGRARPCTSGDRGSDHAQATRRGSPLQPADGTDDRPAQPPPEGWAAAARSPGELEPDLVLERGQIEVLVHDGDLSVAHLEVAPDREISTLTVVGRPSFELSTTAARARLSPDRQDLRAAFVASKQATRGTRSATPPMN